ncbi:DUF431-domain-containing protein [Cantharellus anzutake]|uniref:DUF431-domain-containing protein n=1 Tax=Cantharellus anzutake TaxID=1750568 RepID=UPI0019079705|nr:DUF431-domain-containing protein [Cantharellus anzutake]KAF8337038.1 DUF431-domain-containing protein [Cantharellus anzutake]
MVLEHMEDDDEETKSLPPWVALEYRHILTLAGAGSTVYFTNLSTNSSCFLRESLGAVPGSIAPGGTANEVTSLEATTTSILDLMRQRDIPIERVCLLDPKATQELSPEDGGAFDYFLFGGILGDDPPRDRTSELRVLGFPSRHLGSLQMTTDTALGVTKMIVVDKRLMREIEFLDHPTIYFNAKESVEMPFRYIKINGEPLMPPGMREHLHKDLDQAFDF